MANAAAATLLQSAAPGQFDDVAQNIQKLGDKTLKGNWLAILKAEQEQFKLVGVNQPNLSHPLAEPLREKLKDYQEKTFGSQAGVTARVAMLQAGNDLIVQTYAEKNDTANMYTGYWKATWNISAELGVAHISGQVDLHTMSYEDGNSQMKTSKTFEMESVGKSEEDGTLEGGVVQQIIDWEAGVLGIVKGLHDATNDHLRSIRRVLPITKTKMKWDVEAQRSVKLRVNTCKRANADVNYKKNQHDRVIG
jgi:hypothetical protein